MLKIGVIGLGVIARKAYLPVLAGKAADVRLCTRNQGVLRETASQYRFQIAPDISSLIASGIRGAFVHTSTTSHETIVEELLMHDIHVLVDKPVTAEYASTERLVRLAQARNLLLLAGFNRRFAPLYREMKYVQQVNMILLQKNRSHLPGELRTFVFDDFIHVVDTLLELLPGPPRNIDVAGRKKKGLLHGISLRFTSEDGSSAIGIMNRDSGTTEERLEVFTGLGKHVIQNLSRAELHRDGQITQLATDDWTTTLHKRGFDQMIDYFLSALASADPAKHSLDVLRTHRMCELLVERLNAS